MNTNNTPDTHERTNDEVVMAIMLRFGQALRTALTTGSALPHLSDYLRRYGNGDPRVAQELTAWLADLFLFDEWETIMPTEPNPDPDPDA